MANCVFYRQILIFSALMAQTVDVRNDFNVPRRGKPLKWKTSSNSRVLRIAMEVERQDLLQALSVKRNFKVSLAN